MTTVAEAEAEAEEMMNKCAYLLDGAPDGHPTKANKSCSDGPMA